MPTLFFFILTILSSLTLFSAEELVVNAVGDCGLALNSERPCERSGLFVSLAYLYWKAFAAGTEFGILYDSYAVGETVLYPDGVSQEVNFDAKSGIRATLGYTLPCDGWDLALIYMYDRPSQHTVVNGSSARPIFPLLAFQNAAHAQDVSSAKADWSIQLQTLDGAFGRASFISPRVVLRPHLSGRGVWIDQKYEVKYSGLELLRNFAFYTVEGVSSFQGGGVRLGLESTWFFLCRGLHLFGDLSPSLLWGELKAKQKQKDEEYTLLSLESRHNRLIPSLDLMLGAGWQIWFNEGRNRFRLRLAYEMLYFWNLVRIPRYTSATIPVVIWDEKDLGFHGLTIEGRMDF